MCQPLGEVSSVSLKMCLLGYHVWLKVEQRYVELDLVLTAGPGNQETLCRPSLPEGSLAIEEVGLHKEDSSVHPTPVSPGLMQIKVIIN